MIKNGKLGHRVRLNEHGKRRVHNLKKQKTNFWGTYISAFWPSEVMTGTIVDISDPSVKHKLYIVKPDSPGWGEFTLMPKSLDFEEV